MESRSHTRISALAMSLALGVLLQAPLCGQDEGADAPAPTTRPATAGEPFLWEVTGDELEAPSYLFGTVHLPDDRVLDLPDVVEEAFAATDALFCELPMDMGSQLAMQTALLLEDGKTLSDLLPEELYERTDKLFTSKGLPLAALATYKIWAVASNATILDYLAEMMTKEALDPMLYNRAAAAGKVVGGLETMEEQVDAFDSLTIEEQIVMLEQTLDLIDELAAEGKRPIDDVMAAYISGDDEQLLEAARESMDEDDPIGRKLEKMLIDDRNVRMADRMLEKMLASPETTFFFAVGAMHYPGEKGVVRLLGDKGLDVKKLKRSDAGQLTAPKVPVPAGEKDE